MDNCVTVLKLLLNQLNIKYTNSYVEDCILSHPEHPSLLCLSDTLDKYQVGNLPVKINREKFQELPLPCIAQLSNNGGMFHILVSYSNEETIYLDEKGKSISISTDEFLKKWTGICLLIEKKTESSEPDIEKKLAERNTITILTWAGALFLLLWLVFRFINSPVILDSSTLFIGGYTLLNIVGLAMGTILLWYEVDKYNPTLQNFCTGGKKINCDSVLNSKYAKILGGKLSLGLVGFSYFFGTLGFLIIDGFKMSSMIPLSYLSLASLPFVILSGYYQGLVLKQWCKFCITVQLVLVLEALTILVGGFFYGDAEIQALPLLFALLLFPLPIWIRLKPLILKEKEFSIYKRGLKKLKNNPDVFEGLLSRTKAIEYNPNGLGIIFKNAKAKYDIIKVCNPYCTPCSKAHPILDELYEKGKINLQIIFTSYKNHKVDKGKKVIGHLLALNEKCNKKKAQEALEHWYATYPKNYDSFSNMYPLNGELAQQENKINAMENWCNEVDIKHTPTIFINNRELPESYGVEDLKDLLI